ncbi:MAG: hypothetical protein WBA39_13800 [Rivularia sp. (in: cyanobacteria)]
MIASIVLSSIACQVTPFCGNKAEGSQKDSPNDFSDYFSISKHSSIAMVI